MKKKLSFGHNVSPIAKAFRRYSDQGIGQILQELRLQVRYHQIGGRRI